MAKIYWRRIKAGTRFYANVPTEELKTEIKELAKADVQNGIIAAEKYEQLIGEPYPTEE